MKIMNNFTIKNITKQITTFILGERSSIHEGKLNEHRGVAYTIDAVKNKPTQNEWYQEYKVSNRVSRAYHIEQVNNISW